MDGVVNLEGWRWLFIIEGCGSILVAIVIFFALPDDFKSARYFSEEDKRLMRIRAEISARYNGKPEFDWKEVRKAVCNPKLWISCWSQFMSDVCSFGLSTFMPTTIKGFGYGAIATQSLTIPVYIWRRLRISSSPGCLIYGIGERCSCYLASSSPLSDKRSSSGSRT
jgi:sugar phosphate permease